ncbi:hypothetical protein EDD11_009782 [Mortierella claussenii]|nr:hypothetical protein EDD11_009782 [Mortierella claussenii]
MPWNISHDFMGFQYPEDPSTATLREMEERLIEAVFRGRNDKHFTEFLFEIFLYETACSIDETKTSTSVRFDVLHKSAQCGRSIMLAYELNMGDDERPSTVEQNESPSGTPYAPTPQDVYLYLKDEWRARRLFLRDIGLDRTKTHPSQFPTSCTIPKLSPQDHEHFQRQYARLSPEFQDRFSTIVFMCREAVWGHNGSGGDSVWIMGLWGVEQYTAKYNRQLVKKWQQEAEAEAEAEAEGETMVYKKKDKNILAMEGQREEDASDTKPLSKSAKKKAKKKAAAAAAKENEIVKDDSTVPIPDPVLLPSVTLLSDLSCSLLVSEDEARRVVEQTPEFHTKAQDRIRLAMQEAFNGELDPLRQKEQLEYMLIRECSEGLLGTFDQFNTSEMKRRAAVEVARQVAIRECKKRKEAQRQLTIYEEKLPSEEISADKARMKMVCKASEQLNQEWAKVVQRVEKARQFTVSEWDKELQKVQIQDRNSVGACITTNGAKTVVRLQEQRSYFMRMHSNWDQKEEDYDNDFKDDYIEGYGSYDDEDEDELPFYSMDEDDDPADDHDRTVQDKAEAGASNKLLEAMKGLEETQNSVVDKIQRSMPGSFLETPQASRAEGAAQEQMEAKQTARIAQKKMVADLRRAMVVEEAMRMAKQEKVAAEQEVRATRMKAKAEEAARIAKAKAEAEAQEAVRVAKAKAEKAARVAQAERFAREEADRVARAKAKAKAEAKAAKAARVAQAERIAREEADRAARAKAEAKVAKAARVARAERIAREVAERAARAKAEAEAERTARSFKAKAEAERVAREEAERVVREEAERVAREEAERAAREEAERAAREEAERAVREEAEQAAKAKVQAEDAERVVKAKAEAERLAKEESEHTAEARVAIIAKLQSQLKAYDNELKQLGKLESYASLKKSMADGDLISATESHQVALYQEKERQAEQDILERTKQFQEDRVREIKQMQKETREQIEMSERAAAYSVSLHNGKHYDYDMAYRRQKERQIEEDRAREIARYQAQVELSKAMESSCGDYLILVGAQPSLAPLTSSDILANATMRLKDAKKRVIDAEKEKASAVRNRDVVIAAMQQLMAQIAIEEQKAEDEKAAKEKQETEEKAQQKREIETKASALAKTREEPLRVANTDGSVCFDWQGINLTLAMWRLPSSITFDNMRILSEQWYQQLLPTREAHDKRIDLLQRLRLMFDRQYPNAGLQLRPFGSFVTGLGNDWSDLDICIYTDTFHPGAACASISHVAQFLKSQGMSNVVAITDAKVPIVKFMDPLSGIACDMNIQHPLGIYNSNLIRAYLDLDDRVVRMLYLLKFFGKCHGILGGASGYLSSYAYILMAIVFLQEVHGTPLSQDGRKSVPILPRLQQKSEKPKKITINGQSRKKSPTFAACLQNGSQRPVYVQEDGQIFDCTCDNRLDLYRAYGYMNKKTVPQLLLEFFEFYSRKFDYRTMEVATRVGRVQERHSLAQQKRQQLVQEQLLLSKTNQNVLEALHIGKSFNSPYTFDSKRGLWLSSKEAAYFEDVERNGGTPSGRVPAPGASIATTTAVMETASISNSAVSTEMMVATDQTATFNNTEAIATTTTTTTTTTTSTVATMVNGGRGGRYKNKFGTEAFLCVTDPFIVTRNVAAQCRGERLAKVWRCFDHAYKCLALGEFEKAFIPLDSDGVTNFTAATGAPAIAAATYT